MTAPRCDWAACNRTGYRHADGWWHCRNHHAEHMDEFHPQPRFQVVSKPLAPPRIVRPDLMPCGTRSAFERHRRYGEQPCRPCIDAKADYQRNKYQRRKNQAAA